MFDLELQMRFWHNFTDAVLHSAHATIAASAAWQDQAIAAHGTRAGTAGLSISPEGQSPAHASGLSMPELPWIDMFSPPAWTEATNWPLKWWLGALAPAAANTSFAGIRHAPMMSAMMPWVAPWWQTASTFGSHSPMAQMAKSMAPFWPWPNMTWAYLQMPLTSLLMSAGMPYSVASPSAKASAAAMDAADAAREQLDRFYSAYRSEGGHAASQPIILPWTLAATFMDEATKPGS